jgi:bleomycin hydrolase
MTDDWFDEYMFRLVVHKKYIDSETLKILDQDALISPPWDPMFMMDR